MKSRFKIIGVVLVGLVLFACETPQQPGANSNAATNGSPTAATKADPKVVGEVKEMLAKHDKALTDQSLDAVMATFSTDPKVVLLGTGQGERFVGPEAIKQAYTEIFKDYDKGTFVSTCDWKDGGADDTGKMAWLAATCQCKDSMKGVAREYVLNVSAAVTKQDTGWRFIMLHMSNATAGAAPPAAQPAEKK
jgi:ketosteroid isomerase-like protein